MPRVYSQHNRLACVQSANANECYIRHVGLQNWHVVAVVDAEGVGAHRPRADEVGSLDDRRPGRVGRDETCPLMLGGDAKVRPRGFHAVDQVLGVRSADLEAREADAKSHDHGLPVLVNVC
jgi:hypothetical protein